MCQPSETETLNNTMASNIDIAESCLSAEQGVPANTPVQQTDSGTETSVGRIAICSVGEVFGGVERHILGLLAGLREHGVASILVLFNDGELASQARDQGVETVILSGRKWLVFPIARRLAATLRSEGIGIVHVHGYRAMVFCAVARLWHRFALVKTEHGLPEPMSGHPVRALRERFYRFLDRKAARLTRATICYVTEELAGNYRVAHGGLRRVVIPNGIPHMDRKQFKRPPELGKGRFNLLMVGRLGEVKGHRFAIEALAAEAQQPDIELYIVGTGPRESALRELANALGVADRVHFVGFQRNVYGYIAHCDALLMPSLHEGLPYTLLEAMALGTPVVAFRVGGLAEVLQDGVSALLVEQADVKALAGGIVRLYRDRKLRRQLAKNAQALQNVRYSLTAMIESYCDVYRKRTVDR